MQKRNNEAQYLVVAGPKIQARDPTPSYFRWFRSLLGTSYLALKPHAIRVEKHDVRTVLTRYDHHRDRTAGRGEPHMSIESHSPFDSGLDLLALGFQV